MAHRLAFWHSRVTNGSPAEGDRGSAGTKGAGAGAELELRERKAKLRQAALAARDELAPERVVALSAVIQERLLELEEYRRAQTVHAYVGAKGNEVRTDRILEETLASGRRLVVPRVSGDRLLHHEIRSLSDLSPSSFGLLEPDVTAPRVEPSEIDLIVVPGLAFDRAGNRIGFGKGYYDRFLAEVRAVKSAVLYGLQIVDQVPVDAHDVPVDLLVTEAGVERARRGHGGRDHGRRD